MSMIMLNTRVLFEEPPLGITEVISQTIQILLTHWRPLLSLSLMQFGMAFATGLVLTVVTFIVAGSYVAGVAAIMQQGTYGGEDFGRHLFDRSVGISGASRLLQNYYFGNYNNNNNYYGAEGDVYQMDDLFLNGLNLSATFIVILLLITVVWVVFLALVASIFAGSYSHALAEIYAGGIPCAKRSFGKGVERMWAVYCYQIFLSLVIIGAAVIFVVLPVYLEVSYPSAARMLITILSVFVYIMDAAMLSALMTAAIPSIVVENKSSMEGFQRSIHLCKNFIWFVFCSQFCFEIGLVLTLVLINQILEHLPSFLGLVGHFVVNLGIGIFAPVLHFVLYMSMRIRSENVTQEALALEIGSELVTAHAVELNDSSLVQQQAAAGKNKGSAAAAAGAYVKVTTAEVV